MLTIPLPTEANPNIVQTITLDGEAYTFTYTLSGRRDIWLLRIDDSENAPFLSDTPMIPFVNLIATVAKDERPGGDLLLLTPDNGYLSPSNVTSATFLYVSEDDVVAAQS